MLAIPGMPVMVGNGRRQPQFIAASISTGAGNSGGSGESTHSISAPAGAEPGDQLYLMVAANGAGFEGIKSPSPAGWTEVASGSNSNVGAPDWKLFRRVMQIGDSAWDVGANSCYASLAQIQAWRHATGIGNGQSTGNSITAAEIASTTPGSGLAAFVILGKSTTGSPTPEVTSYPGGMTLAAQQGTTANYRMALWGGYETALPGGGTGTREFTASGHDFIRSHVRLQEVL